MRSTRAAYERAIARYNAGDVAGFVAAHAPECVLVTPAATYCGIAAIEARWTRERATFPDRRLEVHLVVAQGELVATEWTWTGSWTGPMHDADGGLRQPTGARVELPGMALVRVVEGRICEYRMCWDGAALARQLAGGTPGAHRQSAREGD